MSPPLVVRAPAKVNLSLAVLGRRPDGYHELDTVLMALELADVLTAELAGETTLAVHGPAAAGVPRDASNLVLRAASGLQALVERRGRRAPGLRLALEKHVPAAAGLGGGSADAAATVLAGAQLLGLDPDEAEVLALLQQLGSDCAFFLRARATGLARCTGRGERVEPLPALAWPGCLALVTPAFGCETSAVYRALGSVPEPRRRPPLDPALLRTASLAELRGRMVNDLEPAAERSYPELARFHARLEELSPGTFRIAGSGSSWFGFFPDAPSAERVLAHLACAEGGRRYALRGQWVLPARSRGMEASASSLH